MTWEYMVVALAAVDGGAVLLNHMGQHRWELVTVAVRHDANAKEYPVAYLKRHVSA